MSLPSLQAECDQHVHFMHCTHTSPRADLEKKSLQTKTWTSDMTFFLFCLEELARDVYYKLLQLFDSFNIFPANNVKITVVSFHDDRVFLYFWIGFRMRMDHHSCMSRHGGILIFSGDTPDCMFFMQLE